MPNTYLLWLAIMGFWAFVHLTTVVVTLLVAVTNTPGRSSVGKEGLILAHSLRGDSPRWRGCEAAAHVMLAVKEKKKRECWVSSFLFRFLI